MKKNRFFILAVLISLESSYVCFDLLQASGVKESPGMGVVDIVLLLIFAMISLASVGLLFFPSIRDQLGTRFEDFLSRRRKLTALLFIFFLLLLYEGIQDFIFLTSNLPQVQYQGYRVFLQEHYSFLVWLTLISFQSLVFLIVSQVDRALAWLQTVRWKSWGYYLLLSAGIVLLFHLTGFGQLPERYVRTWFEELNAPLIGLQVLAVVLTVTAVSFSCRWALRKFPFFSQINTDWIAAVGLFVIALLSWSRFPPGVTTFTDQPRPPNYANYPRSDALGYQISAQELLAGQGTGRNNHVAFWNFLAVVNLISRDDIKTAYSLRLAIISLLPVLIYLITRELSSQRAGFLAGSLLILREVNSIRLLDTLSTPQLRDQMTEPLTMLGLLLALYWFIRWNNTGKYKLVSLLFIGGILGWVILLRIEGVVYAAAVVITLVFLLWRSPTKLLRSGLVFGIGLVVVAGPWFTYQAVQSGSLSALGMGKSHLVRRVVVPESVDKNEPDRNGLRSRAAIPYNLGNNLVSLLYYLPSNHQPLLTFNNLPDLVLNRVDPADLEGDTYREKYLERYVRSLPYWWNDWDGQLPGRAFLPFSISGALVLIGYCGLEEDRRKAGKALLLSAGLHVLVYTLVGKSGGRFIQVVDWIPLVFYSIGLTAVMSTLLNNIVVPSAPWKNKSIGVGIHATSQVRGEQRRIFPSALLLLLIGLSYPVCEVYLPQRYTQSRMEMEIGGLPSEIRQQLTAESGGDSSEIELLYGKALYPRYFKVGESLAGNNGKGMYTDTSFDRIEFYLVGTENVWAAIPITDPEVDFPHASEILMIGTHSSWEKPLPESNSGRSDKESYFKVSWIVFINNIDRNGEPVTLRCRGAFCQLPRWSSSR